MSDDVDVSDLFDNDFSITSNVFFGKKGLVQKTILSSFQVRGAVKAFAFKKVQDNINNPNYWPSDLLLDIVEYMFSLNISFQGKGLKMYNDLWRMNSALRKLKSDEKEEKLKYE